MRVLGGIHERDVTKVQLQERERENKEEIFLASVSSDERCLLRETHTAVVGVAWNEEHLVESFKTAQGSPHFVCFDDDVTPCHLQCIYTCSTSPIHIYSTRNVRRSGS